MNYTSNSLPRVRKLKPLSITEARTHEVVSVEEVDGTSSRECKPSHVLMNYIWFSEVIPVALGSSRVADVVNKEL